MYEQMQQRETSSDDDSYAYTDSSNDDTIDVDFEEAR
jgi:hypothetical protein